MLYEQEARCLSSLSSFVKCSAPFFLYRSSSNCTTPFLLRQSIAPSMRRVFPFLSTPCCLSLFFPNDKYGIFPSLSITIKPPSPLCPPTIPRLTFLLPLSINLFSWLRYFSSSIDYLPITTPFLPCSPTSMFGRPSFLLRDAIIFPFSISPTFPSLSITPFFNHLLPPANPSESNNAIQQQLLERMLFLIFAV